MHVHRKNEKYDPLTETEDDDLLLAETHKRLQKNGDQPGIPIEQVMADLGISWEELNAIEDVAIKNMME